MADPIVVKLPDGKTARFPAKASENQIKAELDKMGYSTAQRGTQPTAGFIDTMEPTGSELRGVQTAIRNVPSDAKLLLSEMYDTFTDFRGTVTGIYNLTAGGIGKLVPGKQEHEKYINAAAKQLKETYGSWEGFKEYAIKHPVHALVDVASVLHGGGSGTLLALRLVGKAGKTTRKTSRLGQFAKNLAESSVKAGKFLDPFEQAGKGLAFGLERGPLKVTAPVMGVTTGAGTTSIKTAFKAKPEFKAAMRHKLPIDAILRNAESSLHSIKRQRAIEYLSKLNQIKADTQLLSYAPVVKELNNQLNAFEIKLTFQLGMKKASEGLDFSRSYLKSNIPAQNDIKRLVDDLYEWGNNPGDLTAAGMDKLKRAMDNFYHESHNSRAFVSSIRNAIKNELTSNVKGYNEMVQKYEQTSVLLREIERSLSLRDTSSMDTAIKKLSTTVRNDEDFRISLIRDLQDASGQDLVSQISGEIMSSVLPRGFLGRSLAAGQGIALIAYGDPILLGALALASPRVAGEFIATVGDAYRSGKIIGKKIPKKTIFQLGRAEEASRKEGQ